MKTISRYIMTLALLITAVGGAWADDYFIDVNFNSSYDRMETIFHCTIMNQMDPEAEIKGTFNLSVDGVSKGSFNINDNMFDGSIAPVDAGNHTWSVVFSPDGGGSFNWNGNFTIDKLSTSIAYDGSTSINMGEGESTELVVYVAPDGTDGLSYSSSDASVASIAKKEYSNDTYIIQAKAAGTATITFSFAENTNYKAAEEDVTITVTVLPAPIKVTTNAAEEGATFTEAKFTMPAYDATAEYELVRDMSIQMTAKMGDGTDGVRYRVKKAQQGSGYEPADLSKTQVLALVAVNDGIEQKALTLDQDYTVLIYPVDENGQILSGAEDGVTFENFTYAPGLYALKAFAQDDSDYAGETALSNTFKLFQGYEVVIPAGEYVTYYKDEALKVEDQEVELLTITAVEDGKAVLSDASDAMNSNTPFLVHNNGTEEKTILLIPCNEPNLAVTVADEFIGTLTAKEFTEDDMATGDFYVCNGKEFIQVRGAGTLTPNKAYLKVTGNAPASIPFRRSIDGEGEGTTSIDNVNPNPNLNDNEATWYDLGGRKLNGKPAQKGVYIKNGKKVIVP